jgi:hypothetical protein
MDAIADAEIDVNVGSVGDGMISVEKGHIGEVDFPIEIAGGARIVGLIWRAALGKCGGSSKEKEECENLAPQHSCGDKGGKRFAGLKVF